MKHSTMVAILAVMMSSTTIAGPAFTYEGTLKTAQGFNVPTGSYDVVIRIYDAAAGGQTLWCGATTATTDADGRFALLVGDEECSSVPGEKPAYTNILDALRADGVTRWFIGVTIAADDEISPRQELVSVPVACRAATQETVRGELVGNRMTASELVVRGGFVSDGPVSVAGRLETDASARGEFLSMLSLQDGNMAVRGGMSLTGGSLKVASAHGRGIVPRGAIAVLAPNVAVPDGWALCDGDHGTPNLRGLFVFGCTDETKKGTTGGSEYHLLTSSEVPSHTHSLSYHVANTQTKGYAGTSDSSDDDKAWADNGDSGHKSTFISKTWGGGKPHENRPPYVALRYIMKL